MRLGQSSIFPSGETLGVAAMPEPSFTSAADKNDQQFEIAPLTDYRLTCYLAYFSKQ